MTHDEIISIYKEVSNKICNGTEWCWSGAGEPLKLFAHLVAAKALAQHDSVQAKPEPEQEPFAYVNVEKRRLEFAHDYVKWDTPTTIKLDKIPLYTTPPQRTWVGLTDEEIDVIDEATWDEDHKSWGIHDFARAIEAKLKEKNT